MKMAWDKSEHRKKECGVKDVHAERVWSRVWSIGEEGMERACNVWRKVVEGWKNRADV